MTNPFGACRCSHDKNAHYNTRNNQRTEGCKVCECPGYIIPTPVVADELELEFYGLYNPGITDLELDEHRSEDRLVIYVEDAIALAKQLITEARIYEQVKTTVYLYTQNPKDRQLFNNIGNFSRDRIDTLKGKK